MFCISLNTSNMKMEFTAARPENIKYSLIEKQLMKQWYTLTANQLWLNNCCVQLFMQTNIFLSIYDKLFYFGLFAFYCSKNV